MAWRDHCVTKRQLSIWRMRAISLYNLYLVFALSFALSPLSRNANQLHGVMHFTVGSYELTTYLSTATWFEYAPLPLMHPHCITLTVQQRSPEMLEYENMNRLPLLWITNHSVNWCKISWIESRKVYERKSLCTELFENSISDFIELSISINCVEVIHNDKVKIYMR